MTILILEDTPVALRIMQFCLKKFTLECSPSPTEEIIKRAIDGYFTAIIADLHMPHITGIEFATAVRNCNANVPIFIWTTDANFCLEKYKHIFTGQIPKPVKNMQLPLEMVEKAIKQLKM